MRRLLIGSVLVALLASGAPFASLVNAQGLPPVLAEPGPLDAEGIGPAFVTLIADNVDAVCVPVNDVCSGVPSAGVGFLFSYGARPSWRVSANGLDYYCDGVAGRGTIRMSGTGNVIASQKPCGGHWGVTSTLGGTRVDYVASMSSHHHFVAPFSMRATIAAAPVLL